MRAAAATPLSRRAPLLANALMGQAEYLSGYHRRIMINTATLPSLFTERLVLRGLMERDIDALFAIFSDPEVMRYWNAPAMVERTEPKRWRC